MNSCADKKTVIAKKGIIDLRNWDFNKDGIIRLDGEWEFFYNELLDPHELKKRNSSNVYVKLPGRWRNIKDNKEKIGRYGYATYRLKILLNDKTSYLGLKIPTSYVAYTIWIDNKYKFEQGKVAKNMEEEIPKSYPKDLFFNAEKNNIEIIIQNSNFHDESGGFLNSFLLGESEVFLKHIKNNIALDLFLLGVILIFSFYHLMLYLFQRKDISSLIFCIFCFIISIRLLFTNECFLYDIIPNFNFELARKLEYLTICISSPLYVYFIYKQFQNYSIRKVVIISQIIGIVFFLIIISTHVRFYSYLLKLIQIKFIIDSLYVLYVFIDAILKKEIEAVIFFVSFFILLLTGIYEILYHYQLFLTGIFVPMGFVIYIFGNSLILSLKFAKTNSRLEYVSNKLRKYSQELEIKVKERTQELEEANRQKTNFFINFAHEIKTPLTLISNYFEGYIKKTGLFSESMIIKENLDKLTRDMVNILDVEKLTKGQMFYDHSMIINLTDIINKKIYLFRDTAEKRGIKICESVHENIYTKIDAFAIDRILNNLLDNAIKYNKQNGEIKVILKADKRNIVLIISDTGLGIDKEQQKNIFDPYYQLSHHKRNVQGIGIGLNIVKKIITEIDGKITLKSELNKGTEFALNFKRYNLKRGDMVNCDYKVSMPIKASFNMELNNIEFKEGRYNIYIIEDNMELLTLLKDAINAEYNFFYALNGKDALKKINDIPKPDIIVSDIMMDEMDGFEFFENVNKNEEYKSIPFIFLTAKNGKEDRIKGLTKGAIDFISKPFSIEVLVAKIESFIKYREKNRMMIQKDVSNELYNYLRQEFKSLKRQQHNKNNDIEYDVLGKLYTEYHITKKEIEIINLLRQGFEYKEIGAALNISINTVRTFIKRIFKKCNVNSIKGLIESTNKILN